MSLKKPTNYWLIKSEPVSYSIDQLKKDHVTDWNGVRNYQARNYMTKGMKIGDLALFYHSSCEVPAVVGVAMITSGSKVDPTQFNKKDSHFDPKAKKEKPIWYMVEITFIKKLKNTVTLVEIKQDPELKKMVVASQGSRLSIQPVFIQHFKEIVKRGGEK
jgi:predicted RNA-binding protein with PUA-like domain